MIFLLQNTKELQVLLELHQNFALNNQEYKRCCDDSERKDDKASGIARPFIQVKRERKLDEERISLRGKESKLPYVGV